MNHTLTHRLDGRLENERTILANERTLLAYIRTMLTFFIAGVTFIKFFDHYALTIVGWTFIPLSLIVMIVGIVSYFIRKNAIGQACQALPPGENETSGDN